MITEVFQTFLNLPEWLPIPLIIGGLLLIWWDVRRNRNAPAPLPGPLADLHLAALQANTAAILENTRELRRRNELYAIANNAFPAPFIRAGG